MSDVDAEKIGYVSVEPPPKFDFPPRPALMPFYNVSRWYWRADDGRIFSSAKQELIKEDDQDFAEFAKHRTPTDWPRDDSGNQTDASLQQVLASGGLNLFVNLEQYAANKRWEIETGGITTRAGVPLRTDDRSKTMIIGAGIKATLEQEFTTTWIGADGHSYRLSNEQIKEQVVDLQTHIDTVFQAFADIVEQVGSGKITTRQQVDEFFGKAVH